MQITVQPNGALRLTLEDQSEREVLTDLLDQHGNDDKAILSELMDQLGLSPNGLLFAISAEDVGGLTDAPLLTDDLDVSDDGIVSVTGGVWWFPQYESVNFATKLQQQGFVDFAGVPATEMV